MRTKSNITKSITFWAALAVMSGPLLYGSLAPVAAAEKQDPLAAALKNPRVGLFVSCLVNTLRPSLGFAALQRLKEAGCRVEVPARKTCCGQPAFNSGNMKHAALLARRFIETFEPFD